MLDSEGLGRRTVSHMESLDGAGQVDANGHVASGRKPAAPPGAVAVDPSRPIGPGNPPDRSTLRGPGPAKLRKQRLIQERAERLQKAQQVFDLVIGGATIRRAAEMLGLSRSAAHRLYHEGLASQNDGTTDEFRARQMARLERMLHALWPKVLKADANATREARHITDQMSRLMGAYPALGIDLTANVQASGFEGMSRVAVALEALHEQAKRQGVLASEEQAVDELPELTTGSTAA